eukprot:2699332-Rhodomonas_salina.2
MAQYRIKLIFRQNFQPYLPTSYRQKIGSSVERHHPLVSVSNIRHEIVDIHRCITASISQCADYICHTVWHDKGNQRSDSAPGWGCLQGLLLSSGRMKATEY